MTDEEIDARIATIPLDENQVIGVNFLYKHRRVLLGDKMGLGKTLQALTAGFKRRLLMKRVLITCSQSALSVWRDEIALWFPEYKDHVRLIEGKYTKQRRRKLWLDANDPACIYICTYGTFLSDVDVIPKEWDLHIADEVHKVRNHKVKTYKAIRTIQADDVYLLSGTPAPKGARHMFGYLNWLYPKRFKSYWGFINRYCTFDEGPFGREIIGVQNMDELKEILSTIMLRRKKTGNMPKKRRIVLKVDMTPEEEKIYHSLEVDKIYSKADGTYLLTPSAMAANMRCRQLFVCPRLIDPALGYGSGIEAILQHVKDGELDHFVIYSPFPAAFDYLREIIWSKLQVSAHVLRGGMSADEVSNTINDWKSAPKGVILCSIKFATSFSLVKASVGYMLGFEWDADDNYQAEDRQYRKGITEDVTIYYVMHDNVLTKHQKEIVDAKVYLGKEMGL